MYYPAALEVLSRSMHLVPMDIGRLELGLTAG